MWRLWNFSEINVRKHLCWLLLTQIKVMKQSELIECECVTPASTRNKPDRKKANLEWNSQSSCDILKTS